MRLVVTFAVFYLAFMLLMVLFLEKGQELTGSLVFVVWGVSLGAAVLVWRQSKGLTKTDFQAS